MGHSSDDCEVMNPSDLSWKEAMMKNCVAQETDIGHLYIVRYCDCKNYGEMNTFPFTDNPTQKE